MEGKAFTRVNGRKYQTLLSPDKTLFEDVKMPGRVCLVEGNVKVSQLSKLPYFNDTSVSGVGYKAR